jgi:hypothetical protein
MRTTQLLLLSILAALTVSILVTASRRRVYAYQNQAAAISRYVSQP